MYSRNYLSTDNYPILPPGYSGVALRQYTQNASVSAGSEGGDSLPRRPVYEDVEIENESVQVMTDENDRYPEKESEENGDTYSDRSGQSKAKEKVDNESKASNLPAGQTIGKSSHDDILIAGIIMLLLSEGKCDELTLFLLGFLLL